MATTLNTRLSNQGQILSGQGLDLYAISYHPHAGKCWYLRDIKERQKANGETYVSRLFLKAFNTLEAAQFYALSIVADKV